MIHAPPPKPGSLRRRLIAGERATIYNSFSMAKGHRLKGTHVTAYIKYGPVPVRIVLNQGSHVVIEAEGGWRRRKQRALESIHAQATT